MTVIVAYKTTDHSNKMVLSADKRSVAGSEKVLMNAIKIHTCKHFLIWLSGDAEVSSDIEYGLLSLDHIKATYKDLKLKLYPLLRDRINRRRKEPYVNTEWYLHNDMSVLIVTKNKIWQIDPFGEVTDHTERGYAAIWTGTPFALGYFAGLYTRRYSPDVDEADWPVAIRAASTFMTTIWPDADTLTLDC